LAAFSTFPVNVKFITLRQIQKHLVSDESLIEFALSTTGQDVDTEQLKDHITISLLTEET
jgi:hypothetical protein